MLRAAKSIPLFRLIALGQVGLLARRHFALLSPAERRRHELKQIAAKLEPRAFAEGAFRTVSPIGGRRGRRRR
jgi:hypothetical protein